MTMRGGASRSESDTAVTGPPIRSGVARRIWLRAGAADSPPDERHGAMFGIGIQPIVTNQVGNWLACVHKVELRVRLARLRSLPTVSHAGRSVQLPHLSALSPVSSPVRRLA